MSVSQQALQPCTGVVYCGLRGERVLWIGWIRDFLPKSMQRFSLFFPRVNLVSSSSSNISACFETIIRALFWTLSSLALCLLFSPKCHTEAAYSRIGQIKDVNIQRRWSGGALCFEISLSICSPALSFFTRLVVFASHFKSLAIITPKSLILLTLRKSEIVGKKFDSEKFKNEIVKIKDSLSYLKQKL